MLMSSLSEQYATVGVLIYLIYCRDGINDIDYFNYDDITVIIDELNLRRINMCYIYLNSFGFCHFLYIVFYDVTLCFNLICSIVLRVRNKGDDDKARHDTRRRLMGR